MMYQVNQYRKTQEPNQSIPETDFGQTFLQDRAKEGNITQKTNKTILRNHSYMANITRSFSGYSGSD